MILKSYLVEQNLNLLKKNLSLFYGENIGLINEFRKKLIKNKKLNILYLHQDEILLNENIIYNEINNLSLFNEDKFILIINVNDKILNIVENILPKLNNTKVYLFSSTLDKRSKLRSFCEKNEKIDVIPCYKDNEITIKKIIIDKLNNYQGLNHNIINSIIQDCSNDRIKLNNELNKIKTYFVNKKLEHKIVLRILNLKEDDDFSIIKDASIKGERNITNQLLNSTILEIDKSSLYISLLNYRFNKLIEILAINKTNIEQAISEIKPPIFWKERPILMEQLKKWTKKKLNLALKKTYETELKIKSNSNINKNTLIKKLIVDICLLANAA